MKRTAASLIFLLLLLASSLISACLVIGQGMSPTDQIPIVNNNDVSSQTYLIDVNRRIFAPILRDRSEPLSLSLSPDDHQAAYITHPSGAPDVFVEDIYTGQRHQIANSSAQKTFTAWSPDGSQVAYASLTEGATQHNIFVVNLADGISRQLTSNRFGGNTPTWSPDGRYIVFVSGQSLETTDLYVVAADCSDDCLTKQRPITHSLGTELTPSWSPDKSQIAFLLIFRGKLGLYTMSAACIYNGEDCLKNTPRALVVSNSLMSPLIWSVNSRYLMFPQMTNGVREIYTLDTMCNESSCIPVALTNFTRSYLHW